MALRARGACMRHTPVVPARTRHRRHCARSWLGGFRLSGPNGTIQLENPTFRLQSNPLRIDLVSADGRVDVYIDQVMYEFVDGGRQFRIRSADLRLSAAGAARIGHPDQAGLALAEVRALDSWARDYASEIARGLQLKV